MSKWTYSLLIKNTLDRSLKLENINIPYGKKQEVSEEIPAGGDGKCIIYSPAGTPTGIEFYVTYSDIHETGEASFGSFSIKVDIPFWKHKNTSSCVSTGLIKVEGFEEVPDGNHNFQNSILITLTE